LEAITTRESDPRDHGTAEPLLSRPVPQPRRPPGPYRTAPAGQRGRYILHRAPRFNVTAVVWRLQATRRLPTITRPGGWSASWRTRSRENRYGVIRQARPRGQGHPRVKEVLFRHKPGAVSALVPPHDEIHAMYNPTGGTRSRSTSTARTLRAPASRLSTRTARSNPCQLRVHELLTGRPGSANADPCPPACLRTSGTCRSRLNRRARQALRAGRGEAACPQTPAPRRRWGARSRSIPASLSLMRRARACSSSAAP